MQKRQSLSLWTMFSHLLVNFCKCCPQILMQVGRLFNFDGVHEESPFVLAFAGAIMSAIYEEKKDEDGFLYVTYSGENTFGY